MSRKSKLFPDQKPADAADNVVVPLQIPPKPSAFWDEQILAIDAEAAAAEHEIKELDGYIATARIHRRLELPNAAEIVEGLEAELADKQRELIRLRGERALAEEQKKLAHGREDKAANEARVTEAKDRITKRLPHVAKIDAHMKALEPLAVELERSAKALSPFHDVTHVALGRLNSETAWQDALWANAPTFAKLIGLDRRGAMPTMQPLSVAEARFWSMFTPVSIPEVTIEATAGETKPAVDLAAADLGKHGGRALDTINALPNTYKAGDVIPGDTLRSWKAGNLRALIATGKLELFTEAQQTTDEEKLATLL